MSNPPARPTRLIGKVGLISSVLLLYLATTGAALGPDASRLEVTMYSFGYAVAVIVVLRIIVKLFVYLVQAATVLAVLGSLYILVRMALNALF